MNDVNWWLMTLAFLIGLVLTLALMIRKVTREVPVTHSLSAGVSGKAGGGLDVKAPDLGKLAGAGAAVLSGAADKVGAAADAVGDKIGAAADAIGDKIDDLLEREPHGAGSVRFAARKDAPAGYTVKFDAVGKRYLVPGMAGYEEWETEYWFADEASAKAAGFSRWDDFKAKVGDLADKVGDKLGDAADAVGAKLSGAADAVDAKAAAAAGLVSGAAASLRASIDDVPAGPHGKGSAAAGPDGSGPSGWLIKGNADSMLFHGPDSPAYEQTIAEVWFFDEDTARKAGFDKWDKNFR